LLLVFPAPLAEPDWQELKSILLLHLKHDSSTCTTDGNLARYY